jgi:hypothetical protein
MTNESRFMRELRLRQSRLNNRKARETKMGITDCFNDDGELHFDDRKVMALCNEPDDEEDANASRMTIIARQESRDSQRSNNLIQIETRDEDDEVDFIEELAESLSAQPSHLFCEELAREVEDALPRQKDELDEMLDEALRDDDIESHNEESESSSSSSSGSGNGDREEEDCESLNSSIVSDDLRLILSESGLSTSSYQVGSFYTFPGDLVTNKDQNASNRQHLHKKIMITQPYHPPDDASDDAVSDNGESRWRHHTDDDDDEEYEYEYFPEPTVVDLLPGLNAALDSLAERFSFGPCAKSEDSVVITTYHRNNTKQLDELPRPAQAESLAP